MLDCLVLGDRNESASRERRKCCVSVCDCEDYQSGVKADSLSTKGETLCVFCTIGYAFFPCPLLLVLSLGNT